ncbi:MAG: hypothetical protein GC158_00460 [Cyanobacteria bacterium RI_101]|nr:hypothetical protein [Cyanobacteria bacterium RI_101]
MSSNDQEQKLNQNELVVSVLKAHCKTEDPDLRLFRGHKGIISVDLNKARRAIRQTLEKNSAFFGGD